jgi:hypothetical protein
MHNTLPTALMLSAAAAARGGHRAPGSTGHLSVG